MGVKSFFSSMAEDISIGIGLKDDPDIMSVGHFGTYETPYEARTRKTKARVAASSKKSNRRSDRAASSPPPRTVEQFYAELSNKVNWGPLPSLGMTSSGRKNKPIYKDVELREGGEVRSLFQPYG